MKELALCFCLLLSGSLFSQTESEAKAFDSIFYDVAVNTLSSNPTRALHLADSLYNYSINDKQRIKSLMLSASVFEKQEKRKEAIEYAMKALKIAKKSKDFSFQARIFGFMSTQYRSLGFTDKGKEFIQKGLDISSKMENKVQVTKYQAMANHELADYAMDEGEYEKAIEYMNLALLGYNNEEDPRLKHFQVANAEELFGRCYLALGKIEQAFKHFSKAKNLIIESEAANSIWAALIYQGIGSTYLEKGEVDSAGVYLKKALVISEESSPGSLKELIYESMSSYYKQEGELDSSAIYASKYRDISKENSSKKNHMLNSEFNRVTSAPEQRSNNNPIYIIISIILGIGIILTIYLFQRKKAPKTLAEEDINKKSVKSNGILISLRAQEELLQKLKGFELSEGFLDKNMSFPGLVSYLNTNAKYLNYILKKEENKDFNTYINDLRIEYIISKLKSDPEYLNYKISYLADISGFSSHSNFSANFKRVTQFSPSEFIESINNSA